jgi:hypothetical protein
MSLQALEVEHQKAQERCSSTEGKIQTTSNTSRRGKLEMKHWEFTMTGGNIGS